MTLSLKSGFVALAGVAASTASFAADLPSKAPPPPYIAPILVSGWDGFYAGSTYGIGLTHFKTTELTSRSKTIDGTSGGALIGYNVQTGHFVYGVEAGIDLNTIRGNIAGQPGLFATRLDSLDDIRFRGRLGYEFGWIMPFIAGGAVVNETYQSVNAFGVNYGDTRRTVGWTVGGGVDFKFNPHAFFNFLPETIFGPLIIRAEYLHDELPRETFTGGPVGFPVTYRTESSTNLFRLAAIYRFGDTAPRPYADALGNVNWGGGYGGLFGAYGSADVKSRFGGVTTKTTADGGIGGIYAGSNFMFYNNRVMVGFEGSTSFSDLTGHGSEPVFGDRTSYREYVNADIRGRLGYAFGSFLPFVAAGVNFARSEQRDIDPVFGGSMQGRVETTNFTVGGGVDYRVSQRVSLRAEYLYEANSGHNNVNLNGFNIRQDHDENVVRVGAAYHFE